MFIYIQALYAHKTHGNTTWGKIIMFSNSRNSALFSFLLLDSKMLKPHTPKIQHFYFSSSLSLSPWGKKNNQSTNETDKTKPKQKALKSCHFLAWLLYLVLKTASLHLTVLKRIDSMPPVITHPSQVPCLAWIHLIFYVIFKKPFRSGTSLSFICKTLSMLLQDLQKHFQCT